MHSECLCVVMDDLGDLKARIQNVSDSISLNRSSGAAEAYRAVSSSIGSETPIGVLTEIREGQSRLLQELKTLTAAQREVDMNNQRRHEEMCTILLGIAEGSRSSTRTLTGPGPSVSLDSTPAARSANFYGGYTITSGTYLIACILMHIDSMLQAHPRFKKLQSTDTTFMEIKDWFNLCSSALNADKQSKAGLRVPKPTDEDFKMAARVVASPVSGRRPECDPSHLATLLSTCPALMTTVEWMRTTLLKCSGILSPERVCRFKLTKHPFVNESMELLVETGGTLKLPNRFMHQDVLNMKANQKKEYMRLILEESVKPVDAIGMIKLKQ